MSIYQLNALENEEAQLRHAAEQQRAYEEMELPF